MKAFYKIGYPLVLAAFVFQFLPSNTQAALGKKEGVHVGRTIYLGESETAALSDELSKQKFFDETFTVVFKCDRYKRTPDAKSRSVNCLAVSVLSEEAPPTKSEKAKR
jgi:hypothetical protein